MRINVYSQELTREVAVVQKGDHLGVRFYLKSPEELHYTPDDDDRSAITFWVPNDGSLRPKDLTRIFENAAELSSEIRSVQVHQPRAYASELNPNAEAPMTASRKAKR